MAAIAAETAARVEQALDAGEPLLVLGGDCTVELGTVAGHVARGERVGLVYFDVHPDLNTPQSVHAGAFDWMGVAHMLGVEGADPVVSGFGPRSPLLDASRCCCSAGVPTRRPVRARADRGSRPRDVPLGEVASDPRGAAAGALDDFAGRFDRLLVHFDVDTIDFTDAPLSENTGATRASPSMRRWRRWACCWRASA